MRHGRLLHDAFEDDDRSFLATGGHTPAFLEELDEMKQWCREQFGEPGDLDAFVYGNGDPGPWWHGTDTFRFRNDDDALHFKLRWY
ncbi:MAG: hypothetical protein EOP83_34540 [Verrucomicrobiaceae bacterium]|nr:MAG: hypothetical protein EOP83_34540 [Verrucomicrobiaceae bacterium]